MNKHVQIVQTVQALRSVQNVFGKEDGQERKESVNLNHFCYQTA